jgi:arsenate reductase
MAETNVRIYHNPRCSKSREALALLRERGIEPEIVEYLKTPLDVPALKALSRRLGLPVQSLLRTKEEAYREAGLDGDSAGDDILAAIASHPVLLERPIVVVGDKAAIGRPPENVLTLLE